VPFVRANPPLGMRVNVAGTVNVFEAVARRRERIPGVAYASSTAVYGPSDPSPAPESGGTAPATLYGVSKVADEAMARIYASDVRLASIGMRPYIVYGPGRDQGMTSGPTAAMLAAARGEPYAIGFSGPAQYDYAPDVGRAFVTAASSVSEGAAVYNVPGVPATVEDVVGAIRAVVPDAAITWGGDSLPFPAELEAVGFDRDVGPFPRTPLDVGVAATIAHFRAA
jgi:nucleoside-diphosphate-sugar epimerase